MTENKMADVEEEDMVAVVWKLLMNERCAFFHDGPSLERWKSPLQRIEVDPEMPGI